MSKDLCIVGVRWIFRLFAHENKGGVSYLENNSWRQIWKILGLKALNNQKNDGVEISCYNHKVQMLKKKKKKRAKLGLYEQIIHKKHTPDYKTRKGHCGYLSSSIFIGRYTKNSFLCQKLCKFPSMLCYDWSGLQFFSNNSLDSYYNSASMRLSKLTDKPEKTLKIQWFFWPYLSLTDQISLSGCL